MSAPRRASLASALRRALLAAALLAPAFPGAGRAVEPGRAHARAPASLGLAAEDLVFPASDSVAVHGWWFAAAPRAPVVVIAPRGSGTMADVLPAAQAFLARGFAVLTFDYRGFGPASGPEAADTLRYVVFDSKWVDDMVGALRYARARGGAHVFAWGQDLGSAVCVAAAARERSLADGIAIEGLFRTSQEALAANGTGVMNDVLIRHRRFVRGEDEPFSAAIRLRVPVLVALAGKDAVTPPEGTRAIFTRGQNRRDLWPLPEAGHVGAEQSPGYFDRVTKWFRQWTALPPGGSDR